MDLRGCSLDDGVWFLSFVLSACCVSCSGCASRFSPDAFVSVEPPGVLGIPNDANAPDPRPNADEALVDGEDMPPDKGDSALKGFDRAWELSFPKRFDACPRGVSPLEPPSLLSEPPVERDSFEGL